MKCMMVLYQEYKSLAFLLNLKNTIEGLVKAESIKGDYYVFDNDLMALLVKRVRRNNSFGDKVK